MDTNSSRLAVALEEAGIRVTRMLSIGDDRDEILNNLRNELTVNDIVITTGGLGPTKDDITKGVLAELSGSTGYVSPAPPQMATHCIGRCNSSLCIKHSTPKACFTRCKKTNESSPSVR